MNLTPEQERDVEARVEAARAQGHLSGMLAMQEIDGQGNPTIETVKTVLSAVLAMLATVPLPGSVGPAVAEIRSLLAALP